MTTTTHNKSPKTFSAIFQWRSLKTRVTILTLAIFMIGIWSLSFYVSRMLREDMERVLGEQQLSTVSFVATGINDELKDRMNALEGYSKGRIVPSMLANAEALQVRLEGSPIIQGLFNGGVFVTGIDGVTIADVPITMGRMGINYADRDFMVEVLKGKTAISRPVMGKKLKAPVVPIAVPIRGAEGKVIGVLVGVTDLGKPNFLSKISGGKYGKTGGYILVAPQYRQIITASDKKRILEFLPAPGVNQLIDRFIQGYEGSGITISPSDGGEILSSAKGIPVSGWYVEALIPTEEAFAPIHALQKRVLLATIFLTLLAGCLTWWMLKRQLEPVFSTIKTLATLSDSDQPPQPLIITRQDEIGELIGGFNHLLEALKEREEQHGTILQTTMDGFLLVDMQGRLLEVNETYCRMSGYRKQELLAMRIHDLEAAEAADETAAHLQKVMEQGEGRFESRHRRKDGTIFDVEVSVQYRPTEGGRLVAFLQDITNRKQAEDSLRESDERYRMIFNNSPLGVMHFDANGIIIDFNDKFAEIMGGTREKIVGFNMLEKLSDEAMLTAVKDALGGRMGYYEGDYVSITAGKTTPMRAIYQRMTTADGKFLGAVGLFEDVTDRKRAEEEKSKLEAQLYQSQKMEAIGTLAGGIAHDFNNILSVIIGYTELARDRNQKENKEKYLQETLKGAERARNLVKQILTFSRQDDHTEKKPLDIKVLLKEAIKFLRSSIPTTVEINQDLTEESCDILADPTQMHQVIMNLCTNASHAMKETGGTLKIELTTPELGKGDIPNYPDLQPGHYVKLTVSDTGYGIDPAIVQRVFDPFFTTKSVDEGTGLGLSVVYGIVKSHGGVINVYSEQGKGAAFNVYLPRIIQAEAMEVDTGKPVIGGSERILFVDDEPALVDIGLRTLTSLGYQATVAESSIVALDLFRAEPQRFDLIITDMTLPKLTGLELSRELLKIRPDIPIILCSGIKDPGTEAQAKSLGIKAYLTKPLTKRELAKTMRDVLDGREKR